MKNLNVLVQDEHTLVLYEDGQKGDIINLEKCRLIDTDYLVKAIKEGKDSLYLNLLQIEREKVEKEHTISVMDTEKRFMDEIQRLETILTNKAHEIELLEQKRKAELDRISNGYEKANTSALIIAKEEYERKLADLEAQIARLNATKDSIVNEEIAKKEIVYHSELSKKEQEIKKLMDEIVHQNDQNKLIFEIKLNEANAEHDRQIIIKNHEIDIAKKLNVDQLAFFEKDKVIENEKTHNQYLQKITELDKQKTQLEIMVSQYNDVKNIEIQKKDIETAAMLASKESEHILEITHLHSEIDKIKGETPLAIINAIQKTKGEFEVKLAEKEMEIQAGDAVVNLMKVQIEMEKKDLITKHEKEIETANQEIANIKREKSTRSVKKIGEELEQWCSEQFKSASLYGFKSSTWVKDNSAIKAEGESKGTKGDYIFKVFFDINERQSPLTSAMCEMKSEALESEYKKKNIDHYRKLDEDRNKKDLDYAILISELEYTTDLDAPIYPVPGYSKMFVVRPNYFLILLGIIEAIGIKYSDILTLKNLEKIEFKDAQMILDDFEEFKNNLIDNSIKNIGKNLDEIDKSANKISLEANSIINSVHLIINTHLQTVRNKIEQFTIRSIARRVSKI